MKFSSAMILTLAASVLVVADPAPSLLPSLHAQAPDGPQGPPEWAGAVRHDTSRPLREMIPMPAVSTREDYDVKLPQTRAETATDPAVQRFITSPLAATAGIAFDGVGEGNPQFAYNVNSAPPDTTGEAGLTQYVQWVNTSFAVFDKASGTKLFGPAGGNTLFAGFGGVCETTNHGDPIVQYDQLANRWVMTQFAIVTGNYAQCVAVSQTSDALGSWHRYQFSYSEFPDYPKLAVWPDAYYITFNMFGPSGASFTGGRICAYDRAKMLDGLPATQVCFQSTTFPSPLPSDLEGQTLPPPGTPNYMVNRGTSTSLRLWKFAVNFVTPASSTLTGPTSIPVAAYTAATARIPQPGTTQTLDTLGDRLMYRLGYRNLGSREALTVNHSVVVNTITGVRWYELDITGGIPSVRQQATYSPDSNHRWMGSIAMDKAGNIGVGYSTSSSTVQPSVRFAGREATDPLNTLSVENSLQAGTGSQTGGLSRWGDYSTLAIDPVDDCTFWYTSEFLKVNGSFNWSTRIGSFKFASCDVSEPEPDFTFGVTPSSQTVIAGVNTTFDLTVVGFNGYAGDGSFSVTGLPANSTGSFAPTTYTGGSGGSTLTITTAANTSTGSFPLTVTATDTNGTPTHSAIVTLTVNPAPVPDFTIAASPGSRVVKRGKSTTFAVTVTPSGGFNETVTFSVTGCPANTSCTYSPASVNGGGSSTLTIATTTSTPKGTFSLGIVGTSPSLTRSTSVTLKVQ